MSDAGESTFAGFFGETFEAVQGYAEGLISKELDSQRTQTIQGLPGHGSLWTFSPGLGELPEGWDIETPGVADALRDQWSITPRGKQIAFFVALGAVGLWVLTRRLHDRAGKFGSIRVAVGNAWVGALGVHTSGTCDRDIF